MFFLYILIYGNLHLVLPIIETIFCFDNVTEIQKATKKLGNKFNVREESLLIDFYSPITSQGFKVKNMSVTDELAILKLEEMQEYPDFQRRAIHSSQFLYNLWDYTKSKKLIIEYYIYCDKLFLRSEIVSDEIKVKSNKSNKLSEILKNVQFTYISLNFKQNKNPFEDLSITKKIRNQIFLSQSREEISTIEFVKQFSLSVFANYLVLKSEGVNEILTNVGSDGSMSRTNREKNNYILGVPATIKSKQLQLKIIEVLTSIINLYESGELTKEIVDEAKNNNKFYFKKEMIRRQQLKD